MGSPRLDLFVLSASPTARLRQGADYVRCPDVGVAAVAYFYPGSEATRAHVDEDRAAALAATTLATNCVDRAQGVSVRVLQQEAERRDHYSLERLVGSVRLAHWRVQESMPDPQFVGQLVAIHATGTTLGIVEVGNTVTLHRVRDRQVDCLAGGDATTPTRPTSASSLGAPGDLDLLVREEPLRHDDVLVLSPVPGLGARLASQLASLALDAALARSLGSDAPPCFLGLVAHWVEQ